VLAPSAGRQRHSVLPQLPRSAAARGAHGAIRALRSPALLIAVDHEGWAGAAFPRGIHAPAGGAHARRGFDEDGDPLALAQTAGWLMAANCARSASISVLRPASIWITASARSSAIAPFTATPMRWGARGRLYDGHARGRHGGDRQALSGPWRRGCRFACGAARRSARARRDRGGHAPVPAADREPRLGRHGGARGIPARRQFARRACRSAGSARSCAAIWASMAACSPMI
jgi:hypothetical protein